MFLRFIRNYAAQPAAAVRQQRLDMAAAWKAKYFKAYTGQKLPKDDPDFGTEIKKKSAKKPAEKVQSGQRQTVHMLLLVCVALAK